jgi:hypothetical protein
MREYTNKLMQMAEDGVITWEQLAREALTYMSEADVEEIATTSFELE